MLYVIGVAHRAQAKTPDSQATEAQESFEGCLRGIIDEVRPDFIGEEDNEEFLCNRGEVSITHKVAQEKGIKHRFCDPSTEERAKIGYQNFMVISQRVWMKEPDLSNEELGIKSRAIEIAQYFPIREQFWLHRLEGCRDVHAIFVCGDIHIESFTKLLESDGISFKVVQRGIGVNEEDQPYYLASQYLNEHAELSSWN
jgi:hypothetical protein